MFTWALQKILGTSHEREIKKIRPLVAAIGNREDAMKELSDAELAAKTAEFKQQLENGATLDDILVEAFAALREASLRTLKMRHFDVQLIGGIVLHRGCIAEMKTGEGKTLVATLACYLNALSGKGVHVVTVNDYLAKRDAELMGKLYGFMGLSTGVVVNSQDEGSKARAYMADITYGQNNEFGFDYLRDNMKGSALEYIQRPLNFAIIDEADSILIDEARTPLIISGRAEASSEKYKQIDTIIPKLRKDEHYIVDEKGHSVTLTDEGVDLTQELLGFENLYDPVNLDSLHILNQCLKAHTLFRRDVNYLVSEGKVMIIDEFTGRVLAGRRWSDGLHQAVEAKEGVRIQEETRTMATITFQNLFRLYNKIGGMTGTADTEAAEFWNTYKLKVIAIPTNRPIQRHDVEDVVYKTEREKFRAVTDEILDCHERGQPVLLGTVSVEKSNAVAKMLQKRKIPHAVLNAKQHEKEAYVIAQAGRSGAITVSTNMAGRGTDIILGGNAEMLAKLDFKEQGRDPDAEPEEFAKVVEQYEKDCAEDRKKVHEAGGLHILGTERHDSRRIDNQLRGRAGRQGDPGSSRFFLSLEDDLMRNFGGDRVKTLMDRMGMPDDEPIEHPWVTKSIVDAQGKVEARNFEVRKNVLEYDDVMNEQRKTVYTIRQQLLLGVYHPEELDDDGKPTGKMRKLARLDRLEAPVKEEIDRLPLNEPFQVIEAIYQQFGFKTDVREEDLKDPAALRARLIAECTQSLSEQRERMLDVMDGVIGAVVEESCPRNKPPEDWDWEGIGRAFEEHFGARPVHYEEITDPHDLAHELFKQAEASLETREQAMDTSVLLRVFRHYYLQEIDRQWVDHLTTMEHLRDGIGLRGYGQRDPKQEYKKEGFEIFVTMMASIASQTLTQVFKTKLQQESDVERLEAEDLARAHAREAAMKLLHDGEEFTGDELGSLPPPPMRAPRKPAVERGAECPCGSGQPFAECHGAGMEASEPEEAQSSGSSAKLEADEPCICGSGLPFKECHGKAESDQLSA